MRLLLTFALLAGLAVTGLRATVPTAGKAATHPNAELSSAGNLTVRQGLHAELPPHISTLLGLTHEEKCAVLQSVLRSSETIQGIDVTEKNHNDIVIFVVDLTSKNQTLYLTSPTGALRKMLSVKQGVGYVVRPTKPDIEAFQKEKRMWEESLVAQTPVK